MTQGQRPALNPALNEVPLCCYANRLSARPGEVIEFKVSCTDNVASASAHLSRSICADPNPAGPGIIEQPSDQWFAQHQFKPVHQPFFPGSYAISPDSKSPIDDDYIQINATVWPTLHKETDQVIISLGDLSLYLDTEGKASFRYYDQIVCTDCVTGFASVALPERNN